MSYVVYDPKTTLIVPGNRGKKTYATHAAAQAAVTRRMKDPKNTYTMLATAELGLFQEKIEKWVERTNLMSGKTYMERINTPNYCSPASEAYWSM